MPRASAFYAWEVLVTDSGKAFASRACLALPESVRVKHSASATALAFRADAASELEQTTTN